MAEKQSEPHAPTLAEYRRICAQLDCVCARGPVDDFVRGLIEERDELRAQVQESKRQAEKAWYATRIGRTAMRKPRWMHQLYAMVFGYFWLPCPVCGEYFGGHEWTNSDGIPVPNKPGLYDGICNECARKRAAQRMSRVWDHEREAPHE